MLLLVYTHTDKFDLFQAQIIVDIDVYTIKSQIAVRELPDYCTLNAPGLLKAGFIVLFCGLYRFVLLQSNESIIRIPISLTMCQF
jgi:hypothetical protein